MDQLKNLYKNKLENHKIYDEVGDWLELDKKLTKMEFFHFNFYKFNVYYASAILISAICVSIIVIKAALLPSPSRLDAPLFIDSGKPAEKIIPAENQSSEGLIKKHSGADSFKPVGESSKISKQKDLPPLTEAKNELPVINKQTQKAPEFLKVAETEILKRTIENKSEEQAKADEEYSRHEAKDSAVHKAAFPDSASMNQVIAPKTVIRKKVVQKIYSSKRDTIFQIDTIISKKKSYRK